MMRLLPSPSILAGVATALLLATACSQATSQAASFEGTELDPVRAATGFQLHDQFENRVSFSDLVGKVVILTFLYTNCPDICPVITETLKRAHTQLGDDADEVRMVAVSVDPERDTVEQAHRYSERSGMLDTWAFLVGTEDELTPIWSAYYIAAQRHGVEENRRSRFDLPDEVGILGVPRGDALERRDLDTIDIDQVGERVRLGVERHRANPARLMALGAERREDRSLKCCQRSGRGWDHRCGDKAAVADRADLHLSKRHGPLWRRAVVDARPTLG